MLYALMAVAAWLVWRRAGWRAARFPLVLFGLQLVLNVGWSLCFFGFRNPGLAAAEIVVLWLAIAATTATFWFYSRAAALLMGPYLAWTSFAVVLNVAIWRLNA
jgi:tryptophan-rich sensory protein